MFCCGSLSATNGRRTCTPICSSLLRPTQCWDQNYKDGQFVQHILRVAPHPANIAYMAARTTWMRGMARAERRKLPGGELRRIPPLPFAPYSASRRVVHVHAFGGKCLFSHHFVQACMRKHAQTKLSCRVAGARNCERMHAGQNRPQPGRSWEREQLGHCTQA